MNEAEVIARTRRWIADVVVGLNLCPFAQRVFLGERIRYVVTFASDARMLSQELTRELDALAATPIESVETTLLIHPNALTDFLDYNDFQDTADRLLKKRRLEGVIQIAPFHPQFQFAETAPDDVENYTNRSPYPMLHLLREESITNLEMAEEELLQIPERNVRVLREMGVDRMRALRDGGNEPH